MNPKKKPRRSLPGMETGMTRQEAYWASRASKVTSHTMSPEELEEYRRRLTQRRRTQ